TADLAADLGKRLGQIGDEVVGVLDADREPDRRVRDADALARRLRHAGMHRRRRVAYQRFGAAETDRELEDLERVEELESFPLAALDVEGEGGAGGTALLLEDAARRIILGQKGGEVDLGDAPMLGEEMGDDLGIAAGGGHAQRQRLE